MKYYAYLSQPEACDYSIGCGLAFRALKASTMAEAILELEQLIKEDYIGDREVDLAKIYEVNDYIEVSVEAIYKKIEEEKDIFKKEETIKKEKELFEILKQKYDKGETYERN